YSTWPAMGLRDVRRTQGLTQRALADQAGVSRTTVVNLEAGRIRPRPSTLRRLAYALGLPARDLILAMRDVSATGNPSGGAVIFDMDGVLLDSEPLHLQALNEVLAPLGYRTTAAESEQLVGLTSEECWQAIVRRYSLPGDLADYLASYDEAVLRVLRQPIVATRGATELIAGLRRQGFRVGLASASRRAWVDATLSGLGLADAFDVVVSGDDVTHGKPSPDLFVLAARGLGVPADRCVVIEDSPHGVLAAKRAGMTAVALRTTSTSHFAFDNADQVIDSLAGWNPADI
ncbi:MAG TPA: HAD-IA family hydrolase, partial [Chloroflexota bacterium]